jgi:hypothetical protein
MAHAPLKKLRGMDRISRMKRKGKREKGKWEEAV